MKTVLIRFALLFLAILMPNISFGQKLPEFDGAYLENGDGLLEMRELSKEVGYTKILTGGMNVMDINRLPWYRYITQKQSSNIESSKMKGFTIKGNYPFELVTLFTLTQKTINEGFFENHGDAVEGKPFYTPGKQIELHQKSLGNDAYYFLPKQKLEPNDYVIWIYSSKQLKNNSNNIFWIFTVK